MFRDVIKWKFSTSTRKQNPRKETVEHGRNTARYRSGERINVSKNVILILYQRLQQQRTQAQKIPHEANDSRTRILNFNDPN